MNDFNLAQSYVTALTGNPETVMDWRCIHDTDKGVPAHNFRGTLREIWSTLTAYNANGYGIFTNINAMNGDPKERRTLENVAFIRTHVVDLDNLLTAQASYERAIHSQPAPTFAVQTSPGKFHVYWCVQPYTGNDFYTIQQRKLRQLYDGDMSVIDATRVLRVPGFLHLKAQPFMVTCWGLSNVPTTADIIQSTLAAVNVIEHFSSRRQLGDPDMSAPSFDWLQFALQKLDPNNLDRSEWVSMTAAIKQAGWLHTDEPTIRGLWQNWCNRYSENNEAENLKLWNSIRDTEVGWSSIERRSTVRAYMDFGSDPTALLQSIQAQPAQQAPQVPANVYHAATTALSAPQEYQYPDILDSTECARWFKDCYFINSMGKILTPSGRYMDSTKFNGAFGGKQFIISLHGKSTNEAWTAALKSTCWVIPKVDHVRFLPEKPPRCVIEDEMGRLGINTYVPARINMKEGDVSLFLDWLGRILPDKNDQHILLSYMAHCVKFPGFKIPWCPLLQGAKGIGKTVIEEIMTNSLGMMYVYNPPANELVKSGSTFNSWMKNKLMIIVDEIKIDERRELAEVLKPLITQHRIQMQSKGVDQEMEDNPANWLAFSNHRDAMPIDDEERRYCIFFSALQTKADIDAAGMDKPYFERLWTWMRGQGGHAAISHYLSTYPIERGGLDIRAPHTSSHAEAIRISRSPMEITISDCVADGATGFRHGYVSTLAVLSRVKASGIRTPSIRSVESCLEKMGYIQLGRAPRPYAQEDVTNRTTVYGLNSKMDVNQYGYAQGYE